MQVQFNWEQTIERLETLFAEDGFKVVRSFDLQLAREGLLDPSSCPCPNHGTERCTCQYLVYLLYADDPDPITVVVHGYDQRTEVTVERGDNGHEQALRTKVGRLLLSPDTRSRSSRA